MHWVDICPVNGGITPGQAVQAGASVFSDGGLAWAGAEALVVPNTRAGDHEICMARGLCDGHRWSTHR
jgi:hypothetical protein